MSRKLHLRVIAPPLTRAHLVDLLEAYEDSGFFRGFDADMAGRNDAVRRDSPALEGVFTDGILAGREIQSVPLRFQTYALAPTFEMYPELPQGTLLGEEIGRLIGTPLVVSGELERVLTGSYDAFGLDPWPLRMFLARHHGYTAAMTSE